MNNNQLTLLLNGLLAELDTAIDAVREVMPEGAERKKLTTWELKDEYRGKLLLFLPIEQTHDEVVVEGEYAAIEPLEALRDEWTARFAVLESEDE